MNYFHDIYFMNKFKTFVGFSIDRINFIDKPMDDHQEMLDTPPSFNLIKIDEWSAPVKPCPENSSPDTYHELKRQCNEINQMDKGDIIDIVKKYDNVLNEFNILCKKNNIYFPKKWMESLLEEAAEIIIKIKYKYNRPRPFQLAPILGIPLKSYIVDTAKTPSFPSGHACQSKLVANVLTIMYPKLADDFQKLAEMIAYSRYIGGLHFPSDIVYGVELADWMVNYVVLPDQIDESRTIGQKDDLPNISPNEVLEGDDEDARLVKIRQFKGNIEDYKSYWNDRISKGNI